MTVSEATCRRLIGLLDLTSLNDGHDDDIAGLCARAITPHGPVAAVCSWPEFASDMAGRVAGKGPKVAAVIDFPEGRGAADAVLAEARRAVADGADELDLVWPYRAWLAGDQRAAVERVRSVAQVKGAARLKVILETGSLEDPEVIGAASLAVIDAGADLLKTSSGKIAQGASLPAAEAMLRAIRASGRDVGFKASGGIATAEQAAAYLELAEEIMGDGWADAAHFRIGASRLLDALLGALP